MLDYSLAAECALAGARGELRCAGQASAALRNHVHLFLYLCIHVYIFMYLYMYVFIDYSKLGQASAALRIRSYV